MSKRKIAEVSVDDTISKSGSDIETKQFAKDQNVPKIMDNRSRYCPYLDTINRGLLDFDFEKLCSISLSKINVYACLVCGKYFQGY